MGFQFSYNVKVAKDIVNEKLEFLIILIKYS